ncbi:hypothetical protein NLG97_g10063 [Lecanicillium saksenae]|uniref:Uncharacterized protein n=1 Tax=Lecanicillium saksenae TaxID=468837 RepID=A0ACC1QER6_9HYPO|nr:hypothetical protein NLG97_g10063 [Lecanicillium saksenae]
MESHTIVLPGDAIDDSQIPTHPKKPLRLGPGLRLDPSTNEILPTVAGQLVSDRNKNAILPPPRRRARHRHGPKVGRRSLLRAPLRPHGARDAPAAVL